MVIGLSGVARSGKDSFFLLLKSILGERLQDEGSGQIRYNCRRTAFADTLKEDLKTLILSKFNIDIYDCSDNEKEIIRPLMVSYGTLARAIDKNYWIKQVYEKLKEEQSESNSISIITDVRYPNEQAFIKKNFKGSINVYIQRDGNEAPNSDEEYFSPYLKKDSDYIVYWEDFEDKDIESGSKHIKSFINAKIRQRNN
jgi:hypothetical protein